MLTLLRRKHFALLCVIATSCAAHGYYAASDAVSAAKIADPPKSKLRSVGARSTPTASQTNLRSGYDLAAADVQISTLAGDGSLGFQDGNVAHASFSYPSGLAIKPNGDIVVADAGAQRIRLISRGFVKTIAGGGAADESGLFVAGGYLDGPALNARFNSPSGVAVSRDGKSIYIADTGNHCIRQLADNRVTTFAGICGATGSDNGPANVAKFVAPKQMAFDSRGRLYVADQVNGIRVIEADGTVALVPLPVDPTATGVAIIDDVLFAADRGGYVRVPINDLKSAQRISLPHYGNPFELAPLSTDIVAYTDPLSNTVRIAHFPDGASFGPFRDNEPEASSGGYVDGVASRAEFDGPTGIAKMPNNSFIVADSVNRRIRLVSPIGNLNPPNLDTSQLDQIAQTKSLKVAYVGNSVAWMNWARGDSIARRITLAEQKRGRSDIYVYPIMVAGGRVGPLAEFIETDLIGGDANVVVFNLNNMLIADSYATRDSFARSSVSDWSPKLRAALSELRSSLANQHIKLVLVLNPDADDFGLSESAAYMEYRPSSDDRNYHDFPWTWFHGQLLESVQTLGIPYIDLWPSFVDEIRKTNRIPLFKTTDLHLSDQGHEFTASILADRLSAMLPRR